MDGWYRLSIGLGHVALRALDVRIDVEGASHIPREGPVILASTHGAYPDFIAVAKAALERDRHVRFMSRQQLWGTAWSSLALDRMRHIPVDRAAPAGADLDARRLLLDGEAVGTFPEAGISHSFAIRPLMRGTGALAMETGATVVPVAQWGLQRIYTVGRLVDGLEQPPDLRRGRRVDVVCGRPMQVLPGTDLTEWTRDLGVMFTEMLEELQLRPHHRPARGEYAPWYPAHLGGHAPDRREALELDEVPRSAVLPTWGPPMDVLNGAGRTTESAPAVGSDRS